MPALPALLPRVELIAAPRRLWQYGDAGRHLADAIGAHGARSVLSLVGVLQQTLIGEACRRIAERRGGRRRGGGRRGALPQAARSHPRHRHARAGARAARPTRSCNRRPTSSSSPRSTAGWAGCRWATTPSSRARCERRPASPIDAHRDRMAALYSRFSAIAATNPHAWKQEALPADFIRGPVGQEPDARVPVHQASQQLVECRPVHRPAVVLGGGGRRGGRRRVASRLRAAPAPSRTTPPLSRPGPTWPGAPAFASPADAPSTPRVWPRPTSAWWSCTAASLPRCRCTRTSWASGRTSTGPSPAACRSRVARSTATCCSRQEP